MTAGRALREAHAAAKPLVTALAYDALSARILEAAGFPAFNIGGSSLLASRFALPDLGLGALGEMADAMRETIAAVSIPALVDGDDGYGDLPSVRRTIHVLEHIGVGGVLLEDQDRLGKQPGANAAKSVIPLDAMIAKLKTAQAARRDDDLVIVGRTDALGAVGLDEALRRAEAFLAAGADGVFIAGLRQREHLEAVGAALRGSWNTAALFEREGEVLPTPQELHALGFSQVVYPTAIIHRVCKTIEDTARRIRLLGSGERTTLADRPDELGTATFEQAVDLAGWSRLASGTSE